MEIKTQFFLIRKLATGELDRNRILGLNDENGVRQVHPDSVQKIALDYFEKIFFYEGSNPEH